MGTRKNAIPSAVLERARQMTEQAKGGHRQPAPPLASAKPKVKTAREKVIAALSKLHPMD